MGEVAIFGSQVEVLRAPQGVMISLNDAAFCTPSSRIYYSNARGNGGHVLEGRKGKWSKDLKTRRAVTNIALIIARVESDKYTLSSAASEFDQRFPVRATDGRALDNRNMTMKSTLGIDVGGRVRKKKGDIGPTDFSSFC